MELEGLSPRVRGNRNPSHYTKETERPIPAGAGETPEKTSRSCVMEVYPRGCGGKLFQHRQSGRTGRSIPAGAGETAASTRYPNGGPVYPRGCGGNRLRLVFTLSVIGLSPRVRGKRMLFCLSSAFRRSIPAGAGETRTFRPGQYQWEVYPRGCGGN